MKGDLRCVGGRLFRHDPQYDDPDLEMDVGRCPDCDGEGCDKQDAKTIVCDEISSIMTEYRRQAAKGCVDTPGGLEHMGDVWRLLARWDEAIRVATKAADTVREGEGL